jgi:hypothetical protein
MSARCRTGARAPRTCHTSRGCFTRAASRRNPCRLAWLAIWHRSRSSQTCASRSGVRAWLGLLYRDDAAPLQKNRRFAGSSASAVSGRDNIFLMSHRRSGPHEAASSTQPFSYVPDPLLRCSVSNPSGGISLFTSLDHRHAIIRRIRRSLSLFSAFCQFFGIYPVINHDALLLCNKLVRQQAVGVALDSRDDAAHRKFES